MYQAIRAFAALAIILNFLTACGGESSGASTSGSGGSNGAGNATTTSVNSTDPVVLSGAQFYQGGADLDDEYGCVACHGLNGEGGAFQAINTPAVCDTCVNETTLTNYIAAAMPNVGAGPGSCIGTTDGTCANDIAKFMMAEWINPSTPIPGISVNAAANLATSEAGTTASFSVRLDAAPTNDVVIGISSNDTSEGTVNTAQLVFTTANWNQPQTVVVTGVDDGDVDGNIQYTIVVDPAVSADADYNGMNPADILITNNDDDVVIPAGITVNPTVGLITTEAGVMATFIVVLDSMPTDDVTINIASSDTTEGTTMPASLTFTSANYNLAQTVTVTGIDDADLDGNVAYMVMTSPAVSNDLAYSGLDASDVSLVNNDDEVPPPPGIAVNPTAGLMTTEAGGTDTFTVVLESMPIADVTIGLVSSNIAEGTVNPASLTFNTVNWNIPQTVTVTGVDEMVDDGNIAYTIETQPANSADTNYLMLDAADVSVTNVDDDENPLVLGQMEYQKVVNGQSCESCHGAQGQGVAGLWPLPIAPGSTCLFTDCNDQAMISAYIELSMPKLVVNQGGGMATDCDATCAGLVAQYILNNFQTQ